MDEAFYVLEGRGVVTLNDTPHTFEKGGTIFIPRNSWHGFSNPDHELLMLWIISPAGLHGFFARPVVHRALRQSNSRASKSVRLLSNTAANADNHSSRK
jgi:quercetin dioxygenase-like cupin family protein